MIFCLDTSIIIDLFRGNTKIKKRLDELKKRGITFCTACICMCELFKGAHKSADTEKAVNLVMDFYKNIRVLNFDLASSNLFGLNFSLLEKKGRKIPEADIMIASLAASNNCVLITKDKNHFNKLPGLNIEVWPD
ncbi:PIN domain-containing protein [Candidatus Woesearchaeota archaeon]|nr:PIN domain-containing protein [Candidatus Woesearchaeota archaeon]